MAIPSGYAIVAVNPGAQESLGLRYLIDGAGKNPAVVVKHLTQVTKELPDFMQGTYEVLLKHLGESVSQVDA